MKFELNPKGIGVATINPGFYRTGFNETGAESYQAVVVEGRIWSRCRQRARSGVSA